MFGSFVCRFVDKCSRSVFASVGEAEYRDGIPRDVGVPVGCIRSDLEKVGSPVVLARDAGRGGLWEHQAMLLQYD